MKAMFFIGLVVPGYLAKKIQEIKADFSVIHGTRHGLQTIPHITLEPPFWENPSEMEEIKTRLDELASKTEPFEVLLDGYGSFGKKVIFINVLESESLKAIYHHVRHIRESSQHPAIEDFKPHITIAHRDLKPSEFSKAWPELRVRIFRERFKCESISVLEHRNGSWEVIDTFYFKAETGN